MKSGGEGVGGKVETHREKMIKRSCGFLSGYNSDLPSFLFSLNMTERERDGDKSENPHILLMNMIF